MGSGFEFSTVEFRNPSSGLSSVIDEFGSDPVARMVAEGPQFREGRYLDLMSGSFDADEVYLVESIKEEQDALSETSSRASRGDLESLAVTV